DAYPDRQDLDVDRLRLVAESGGWVSIGTDAHTPSELVFFEIGIAAAILAGLPRERILNYLPLRQLREWAGRIRARRHGGPAKREEGPRRLSRAISRSTSASATSRRRRSRGPKAGNAGGPRGQRPLDSSSSRSTALASSTTTSAWKPAASSSPGRSRRARRST